MIEIIVDLIDVIEILLKVDVCGFELVDEMPLREYGLAAIFC